MDDYPFLREVRSPITDQQLRPLDPRCRVVQFSSTLVDSDFRKLSRFIEAYPAVSLRIYGHEGIPTDLEFLRHFPFLKGFQADRFDLTSLAGLEYLPTSLLFLGLGATQRRFSLKVLFPLYKPSRTLPGGTRQGFFYRWGVVRAHLLDTPVDHCPNPICINRLARTQQFYAQTRWNKGPCPSSSHWQAAIPGTLDDTGFEARRRPRESA